MPWQADSEREFTWWGNSGAGAEGAGEDAGPAVLSRVSSSSSVASVASASSSASMDFYWTMRGVDPQGLEAGLAGLSTAVQQQHGAPARSGGGCYRNAADIPREALVVQLRRMRFALLGQQAGAVDKRQEARYDALSHSVPIAEMGNFHEVLRRREAEGASPLRDPHLDKDDEERRRRMQFGNPFRKAGDKHIMLSDEIEAGEAAAAAAAPWRAAPPPRPPTSLSPSQTPRATSDRARAGQAREARGTAATRRGRIAGTLCCRRAAGS